MDGESPLVQEQPLREKFVANIVDILRTHRHIADERVWDDGIETKAAELGGSVRRTDFGTSCTLPSEGYFKLFREGVALYDLQLAYEVGTVFVESDPPSDYELSLVQEALDNDINYRS